MKKIFTLLASFVLSIGLFAATAKPKSTLTIQSADRTAIKVVIDGRRFEPNDNFMRIQGLDAGSHMVKIYSLKSSTIESRKKCLLIWLLFRLFTSYRWNSHSLILMLQSFSLS